MGPPTHRELACFPYILFRKKRFFHKFRQYFVAEMLVKILRYTFPHREVFSGKSPATFIQYSFRDYEN